MKKQALMLFTSAIVASTSIGAQAVDRVTYTADKSTRGTTVTIPESKVIELCGDQDGCEVRLAMYDWDGLRRRASRETLFFYNPDNRNWRDSVGDTAGTSSNNGTQHVEQAWACYFTDGKYADWTNLGDVDGNFGLLSWNQYDATCEITLID
ncbi:hypothetical protein [Gynuella sunshinyii]|uniref:Uncharacterized protein n=1 Tax=Gynuella sunshinyii YC6258 TaxID=1445510 RepID=A0A0C5V5U5_9GAMM|nr:hypothetical protein [Gynuella sunshinyii]AJQ94810.1 hypothetical Protein YC6258_02772 [Gynuella sunshinyii YC6258]